MLDAAAIDCWPATDSRTLQSSGRIMPEARFHWKPAAPLGWPCRFAADAVNEIGPLIGGRPCFQAFRISITESR